MMKILRTTLQNLVARDLFTRHGNAMWKLY